MSHTGAAVTKSSKKHSTDQLCAKEPNAVCFSWDNKRRSPRNFSAACFFAESSFFSPSYFQIFFCEDLEEEEEKWSRTFEIFAYLLIIQHLLRRARDCLCQRTSFSKMIFCIVVQQDATKPLVTWEVHHWSEEFHIDFIIVDL